MYRYIPLHLNLLLDIEVYQWLQIYSEPLPGVLCHGQRSLLLAGPPSHYPQCHKGLAPSRNRHECPCRSMPRGGSWYDKWEGFALNCLQTRQCVRVVYNTMLYRIYVPIIVQCQSDGCSLSSKAGTEIRESFEQLTAGCLNHYGNGGRWPLLPPLSRLS